MCGAKQALETHGRTRDVREDKLHIYRGKIPHWRIKETEIYKIFHKTIIIGLSFFIRFL